MTFIATDGTVCNTESERFWYESNRGIEPPRREMPPDALCENGIAFVTEDETNWIVNFYDSRESLLFYSKNEEPYYPVALVTKWLYRAVNRKRIEEIAERGLKK
jgi:hypothetical protein